MPFIEVAPKGGILCGAFMSSGMSVARYKEEA